MPAIAASILGSVSSTDFNSARRVCNARSSVASAPDWDLYCSTRVRLSATVTSIWAMLAFFSSSMWAMIFLSSVISSWIRLRSLLAISKLVFAVDSSFAFSFLMRSLSSMMMESVSLRRSAASMSMNGKDSWVFCAILFLNRTSLNRRMSSSKSFWVNPARLFWGIHLSPSFFSTVNFIVFFGSTVRLMKYSSVVVPWVRLNSTVTSSTASVFIVLRSSSRLPPR